MIEGLVDICETVSLIQVSDHKELRCQKVPFFWKALALGLFMIASISEKTFL